MSGDATAHDLNGNLVNTSFFLSQSKRASYTKSTHSTREQEDTERSVWRSIFPIDTLPVLDSTNHINYLMKGLHELSSGHESLDASTPWLCFWILHSLEILSGPPLSADTKSAVVQTLRHCVDAEFGGYGGGPLQRGHLATTYAAVCALVTLGTEEALQSIDILSIKKLINNVHYSDGSLSLHVDGELDVRAAYCAAVVVRLLNLDHKLLLSNTPQWVASCQSYDGGFSALPFTESHGGYTFCSYASLVLLGHEGLCDISALIRWVSFRQMSCEGGFSGRPNKLVDGCYSFWQAGVFPLAQMAMQLSKHSSFESLLFNQSALQEYILRCCQHPRGGFIDKPGTSRDYYHTCYCLSGLSLAQSQRLNGLSRQNTVVGPLENLVAEINPVYNLSVTKLQNAFEFFAN